MNFTNLPRPDPELRRLLQTASSATEAELREQRISFAYGNLSLHDSSVSKESVRYAAEHLMA